jgi:hypothetical protein
MNSRIPLYLVTVALLFAGCASTPPVQPAATSKSEFASAVFSGQIMELEKPTPGAEAFRAFHQGATGFVSVASVRGGVEKLATQHCTRRNQVVRPIQETSSTPPHILGNFPRVEWLFECVERPKIVGQGSSSSDKFAKLEQLKKLLDDGILTRLEFESEKAKLLALP